MVGMDGILEDRQGQTLLKLARNTLERKLTKGEDPPTPTDPALLVRAATFVTLKIAGRLRGCIGNLEPVGPLWEGIRDNAIHAAFHDHRFSPLSPEELPKVHLDISILSPPLPLDYADADELLAKLRPDIDGVILRDGRRSATFLPQVWQQLPRPEQFLGHLCLKAGLPQDYWRQAKLVINTYQVQCFAEKKE